MTPKPKKRSLLRKGAAQFAGQFLGLVLALLVSHLIARRMGIGPEADAFLLGRRLITSVSEMLNQVLVVVFIPLVAAQASSGISLRRITLRTVGPGLLLGVALTLVFSFSAMSIVAAVAPDFPPGTRDLAARVIVLLSFALPALVGTIALSSYCNVHGVFGPPAALRQVPRASVAFGLAFSVSGAAALAASRAYTLATWAMMLTLFAVAAFAHRGRSDLAADADASRKPNANAGLTRQGIAATILAGGAMATLWLETAVAARQGLGGLAMLEFGQRLGALLGNTLATALGLVIFADLSRRAAQGKKDELGPAFQRATVTGLALAVPITVGMICNADALVELLLSYGAFSQAEARGQVVVLVQAMAIAPLGALALRMMLARVLADAELPVVKLIGGSTLADFVTRAALFALLVTRFGLEGIAFALILTPVAPALFLVLMLRRRNAFGGISSAAFQAARPMLMASIFTAVAVAAGALLAPDLGGKSGAALQAALSAMAGLVVLGGSVVLLRVRPRLT